MHDMQATRGASLTGDDETKATRRRRIGTLIVVAAIVVALDQSSKIWAMSELADGRTVPVAGDFLRLRLVRNSGAAFGVATNLTLVLSIVAIGVVAFILRISRRLTSLPWAIALGGFLGGAVGNLTDRIFREPEPLRGHVVDFLELPNWPVFNLADSAIVGAAVLVAVLSFRGIAFDAAPARVTEPTDSEPDAGAPREQ